MGTGLETTLKFLTKTKNDAASLALVPALDCTDTTVQDGALRAILERRSLPGQRELIRRLHTINDRWRELIDRHHTRMTTVLRDALQTGDPQQSRNACQAAIWFRDYELIPALVTIAEDERHTDRSLAAATILQLADVLYDELAAPPKPERCSDPQTARERVVRALEKGVSRFKQHRQSEILEAFLLLAHRDNHTLGQILHDPLHPSFPPLVEMLTRSARGGVLRLVLSFVDDPQAPTAALHVLSRRGDPRSIDRFLKKIGPEPSPVVCQNLKRLDYLPWLLNCLQTLDDSGQQAAVQLAIRSGLKRPDALQLLKTILQTGSEGGRRAAARALSDFTGADANAIAVSALGDADPLVQSVVLGQLRSRGVPGAMSKLVEALDSPHEVVLQAARAGLCEFTFAKFLQKFDGWTEENRRQAAQLVPRVDLESPALLAAELTAPSRLRRLRGLAMVVALGMAERVEGPMLQLLRDEDHLVRLEAARVLADCDSPNVCAALRETLLDNSVAVQEAAEESLQAILQRRPQYVASGPNNVRAALAAATACLAGQTEAAS